MSLDVGIASALFFVLILPFSLICEGIRRKIIARMQNRIGPPIWQPIYDVIKLFKKSKTDALGEKNLVFRLAPIFYFLSTYALFLFIPLTIISFEYDFILLIYILVLNSAFYIIAGVSSNSPYGIIGSMRELALMVCYEMMFATIILTIFVFNNIVSFAQLNTNFLIIKLPLAAICFFYIAIVEVRVTPYDTVEAPTEILAGATTEFSGKRLMFLEFSKALKLVFFAMAIVYLFVGYFSIFSFLLLTLAAVFLLAFTQATTCRYRIDQAIKRFTFVFVLALIEFIRIRFIVW